MDTGSTWFLRAVIYIIGLAVFAILGFGIPYVLIANNNVGMYIPILIGLYFPAIPFIWALWQGLRLLDFIDAGIAFSEKSVYAIRIIKICATLVSIFYTLALPYVFYVADLDDAPGVVVINLVFIFAPLVIAVFAAVLQSLLKSAMEIKNENDLTV